MTQATSPCDIESKAVAPSKWSCKAYKLYIQLDCAYRVNQCSRGQIWSHLIGPKLFVLLQMVKMLLDVACQLAYSWLYCFTIDNTVDLLCLLMHAAAWTKEPLPCHVIYMWSTNLIYRACIAAEEQWLAERGLLHKVKCNSSNYLISWPNQWDSGCNNEYSRTCTLCKSAINFWCP